MSLDTPSDNLPPEDSREALEARLTALLLGELSAEDAVKLRAAIAQDPELEQLRDRLALTMGLVREAASSLNEEATPAAEPLKLSSERREKLLESFKVIRPWELAKRRRLNWGMKSRELAALALAETIDAIEVLSEGALEKNHEAAVLTARAHLFSAKALLDLGRRAHTRSAIANVLEQSIRSLRSARLALANPATLPATYRN